MSQSPSKRVLWTLVATVAVVGGTISASAIIAAQERQGQKAPPSNPALPITIGRDLSLANSQDTDGDSLFDWEEALRGTNPKKTDSDDDGTSDGAEVSTARDPLVAGPNDSVAAVASSTDAAMSDQYEASRKIGTLTDQFAETFAKAYASEKMSGGFSSEDQASLIQRLSGSLSGEGSIAASYRQELVPTFPETDVVSLQRYADAFAKAHLDAFTALGKIDAATLGPTGYSARVGQGFRDLGKALCSLATPAAISDASAQTCNVNETMGIGIAALGNQDDPLAALLAMPSLQKAEEVRADSYSQISLYLASRGVTLQTGEYAGFWGNMAAN